MEAALRPLAVGESLDAAIKIYRRCWRTLFKTVAVVIGPTSILVAIVRISADTGNVLRIDPSTATGEPTIDASQLALRLGASLVTAVIGLVAGALATAASLRVVAGAYLGDRPSWADSIRFALRRLGALVVLAIAVLVCEVAGLVCCIAPGVWLWGSFGVAIPALLLEGLGPFAAMGRSFRLVRGRFWPVFGVLALAAILEFLIEGALSGALVGVVFGTNGNEAAIAVTQLVTTFAASLVATPFVAAVAVVVYFDLRVRKEGYDLWLLARHVGAEPPRGGFPVQPGVGPQHAGGWPASQGQPPYGQPGHGQPGHGQAWRPPPPPPPPPPPAGSSSGPTAPRSPERPRGDDSTRP